MALSIGWLQGARRIRLILWNHGIRRMLVYEIKFADPELSCELLFNIQVHHLMNGISGFTRLVGVVTDKTGKHLKSYLLKFPKVQRSLILVAQDQSSSWTCRENLAKQLVEGVSQLHTRGFVVGILFSDRSLLLVDGSNDLHFWHFRSKLAVGNSSPWYPPEFRHLGNISQSRRRPSAPM